MNRPLGIVTTGIVAGAAYLLAQAVDLRVTNNRIDDRILLGRLAPLPRGTALITGTLMHQFNAVLFSGAFRLLIRDRIHGPMWRRGLQVALVETLALYPLALLEDHHPAIRSGELDSYRTKTALFQQLWRHAAFGLVLGALTPKRG